MHSSNQLAAQVPDDVDLGLPHPKSIRFAISQFALYVSNPELPFFGLFCLVKDAKNTHTQKQTHFPIEPEYQIYQQLGILGIDTE